MLCLRHCVTNCCNKVVYTGAAQAYNIYMLKHCVHCGFDKPWNPSAKLLSKARGFHGSKCWSCFLRTAPRTPEYQAAYLPKYRQTRYQQDFLFAARCRLSSMTSYAVRRLASNKPLKDSTTLKVFGCKVVELKQAIESQFSDTIHWDTYGEWELDHKIAVTTAKELLELRLLYRLANVQVLSKPHNRKKAANVASV